jgi:hypothetical protein
VRCRKWNVTGALQLDLGGGPCGSGREVGDLLPPVFGLRIDLEPVRADVDDAGHADALLHIGAGATADDRDETVAGDEPRELAARRRRRVRILRPLDDRRQDAVEVEEEPRFLRGRRHVLEQRVGGRGHPRSIGRCVSS